MLRMLAVIAVFGGCALLGMRAAASLKHRQETLSAMLYGFHQLAMWMDYTAEPLTKLIRRCRRPASGVFWDAFTKALEDANHVPDAWNMAMEQARNEDRGFASLEEPELQAMAEFAEGLGNSDRTTQARNAALLQQRLAEILKEAQAIYGRKGRMYRSMGILSGIAAAILLL